MKKLLLPIIIIVAICIAAGGYYYYHYNYVEEVTDRYLVRITPHEDSAPGIEVSKMRNYTNDSVAIDEERKEAKRYYEAALKKYEKDFEKMAGENEAMRHAADRAYNSILSESRTVLIFRHVRSLDVEEAIGVIKKHGLKSDYVEKYTREKKLQMDIIPVN